MELLKRRLGGKSSGRKDFGPRWNHCHIPGGRSDGHGNVEFPKPCRTGCNPEDNPVLGDTSIERRIQITVISMESNSQPTS